MVDNTILRTALHGVCYYIRAAVIHTTVFNIQYRWTSVNTKEFNNNKTASIELTRPNRDYNILLCIEV